MIEIDRATRPRGTLQSTQPSGPISWKSLFADRRFTTAITLLPYCALLLVAVSRHEPWADEAHPWVLSRDVSYRYLVFNQLAYNGHPPLWNSILWVATHWFHLPYSSLGWIATLCAIAGCWFFCWYSPFPAWVRVLFPFTYFMAFQYAVVARPYVLLPWFTFAAAHAYTLADRRPWRFVAATSALTVLCAPGVVIAGSLTVARGWGVLRSWKTLAGPKKTRLIAALAVFALVAGFISFVNWPPPDRSYVQTIGLVEDHASRLATLSRNLSLAFFGSWAAGGIFLAILGMWCWCRRSFLPFALPILGLLGLFGVVYGNMWHSGALTLAAVAALWIAWPQEERCKPRVQRALNVALLVGLGVLLAIQFYWTGRTVAMDYQGAYSGSLDAANFLRSVGAQATDTCGFGFHSVAVQPYFPSSLYKNWPTGEAFYRFEKSNRNDNDCYFARWVVVPICCNFEQGARYIAMQDRAMRGAGYVPVHFSRGTMYFEGREVEPTDFVIYRRAE